MGCGDQEDEDGSLEALRWVPDRAQVLIPSTEYSHCLGISMSKLARTVGSPYVSHMPGTVQTAQLHQGGAREEGIAWERPQRWLGLTAYHWQRQQLQLSLS